MSLDVELTDLTQEAARNDITANENFAILNALMRRGVTDRTNTPPSLVEGRVYIITAGPTGQWASDSRAEHDLAIALAAKWVYLTPTEGWLMRVQDENAWYYFDGAAWVLHTALNMAIAAALADLAALTASSVGGSSGGSADGTLADNSTAVTGVDGTGNNAASKADVDARLVTIADNFADLQQQINNLVTDAGSIRTGHNTLLANRRTANEQS